MINTVTIYHWEHAASAYLIYHKSDAELVDAITEACATPRSIYYLDHMRMVTQHRRGQMPNDVNVGLLRDVIAPAERAARLR